MGEASGRESDGGGRGEIGDFFWLFLFGDIIIIIQKRGEREREREEEEEEMKR